MHQGTQSELTKQVGQTDLPFELFPIFMRTAALVLRAGLFRIGVWCFRYE